MTRMVVITKSYAPDFQLCADLRNSVLENAAEPIDHHIIVPRSDLKLFAALASPRTHIHCEEEFVPRSFVSVPLSNYTLNLRRPFPPVRGWMMQQVIKLAAASTFESDVVLIADSDVAFVRPFGAETFIRDGVVRFFHLPDSINADMRLHVVWHRVARSLLGLAPPAALPLPDYISALVAWDPVIVRNMLEHVANSTGRPWPTAIAGQLHFSECILYGTYVDHVADASARSFASSDPLCNFYWGNDPLDSVGAISFLNTTRATDIAAMISAKSHTPLAVRRAAYAEYRAVRDVAS